MGELVLVVGLDGGVQTLACAVEPVLADRRELLAALPEGQRLLERGAACLERADDLDELLAGLLVRRRSFARLRVVSLLRHGDPPCWWWSRGSGRRRRGR